MCNHFFITSIATECNMLKSNIFPLFGFQLILNSPDSDLYFVQNHKSTINITQSQHKMFCADNSTQLAGQGYPVYLTNVINSDYGCKMYLAT